MEQPYRNNGSEKVGNARGIILITFLLILSITLNMLAFFFIVLLYIRQNRFVHIEKQQRQVTEQMEEVISAFIAEVKEENDQFIAKFQKIEEQQAKANQIEKQKGISYQMPSEKNRGNIPKALLNKQMVRAYQSTAKTKQQPEEEITENLLDVVEAAEAKEEKEKTLLDQAVELQKQGKKLEEIAKILNKGKTEIELLLKFGQK